MKSTEPKKSQSNTLVQIVRGAGVTFALQCLAILVGLLFNAILARLLGAELMGVMAIALSTTAMLSVFTIFGIDFSLLKLVSYYRGAQDDARAYAIALVGLAFVVCISLIILFILLLFSKQIAEVVYSKPELTPVFYVMFLSLPFTSITLCILAILQAQRVIVFTQFLKSSLIPLFKLILVALFVLIWGPSLIHVASSILVASILGALVAGYRLFTYARLSLSHFSVQELFAEITQNSIPMLLTSMSKMGLKESYIIILGLYVVSRDVGIFFVGLRISALLTVFMTMFSFVTAPMMSEFHSQNDWASLNDLFRTTTKWSFMLCIPVFLILFIFSREILGLLGAEYSSGATILRILLLTQLFNVGSGSIGWLLVMTGHLRVNLVISLLSVVTNVVLISLLASLYGINGAAIGGALSLLIMNVLGLTQLYRFLKIQPYNRSFLKPVIAGFIALAAARISMGMISLPHPSLLNIALTSSLICAAYAAVLFILGFDESDQFIIKRITQTIFRRQTVVSGA